MKIKRIQVENFKAISSQDISFDGCSAIIVGGNNKGKSSLLRGLIDRFRGEKPEMILKKGEKEGFFFMELTDGSKIEWNFAKTERFKYITKEGWEVKSAVLSSIGKKYFGSGFDIDTFLRSGPKDQLKMLQDLVGLDCSKIDHDYKNIFDKRRDLKRDLKNLEAAPIFEPAFVQEISVTELEEKLERIKLENVKIKEDWQAKNKQHLEDLQVWNNTQREINDNHREAWNAAKEIDKLAGKWGFLDFIDKNKILNQINNSYIIRDLKQIESLPEPEYIKTEEYQKLIDDARETNRDAKLYKERKVEYETWKRRKQNFSTEIEECNLILNRLELEKKDLISKANFPNEFEIKEEGIYYEGFPISDNQISSSSKYIAALKLGSLALGDLRAIYFDASYLDKQNLQKIQEWAEKSDLQLLIERPDYEGGDITYEIIQENV